MTTLYNNNSGAHLPDFFDEDSGFPFDDSEDRGLRSRLDDIAQRHPEFAGHLNPDNWGRPRTSSSSASEDPFISRFRNRSRIHDFGFPFDDFEDPTVFEHHPHQSTAHPQQSQPQHQRPEKSEKVVEKPPSGESKPATGSDTKKAPIQQSNTVDLGQPQEPLVDDIRNHRSMSAPPDNRNRASGKRFVSSINIPNVNADMGGATSQEKPPAQSSQPQNPKERIIPIHIEGRDEPVIPKNVHTSSQSASSPQSERIFGQRPSTFTQYVNPQEKTAAQEDLAHQEELRRQQQQQKFQEYQRQQQQQQRQEQEQPAPTQPTKKKPTSLELIHNIQQDVSELMTQVENFAGKPKDKTYLYLDEMLTRKMLLLDDIETAGQDAIRKARKEAIKCIQDTIKVLENKALSNEEEAKRANQMNIQEKVPDAPISTETKEKEKEKSPEPKELVVGGVTRTGQAQVTTMEVEQTPTDSANGPAPAVDADKKTDKQETDNKVATDNKEDSKAASAEVASEQVKEEPIAKTEEGKEPKEGGSEKKKVKKKAEKK